MISIIRDLKHQINKDGQIQRRNIMLSCLAAKVAVTPIFIACSIPTDGVWNIT